MSACLYCPVRIAMSRKHGQTPHASIGHRGLCPTCTVAVGRLISSGRYTEAQIIERGWKLPPTTETAAAKRRWLGIGFKKEKH